MPTTYEQLERNYGEAKRELTRLSAENAELKNIRTLLMVALAVAIGRPHSRKDVQRDTLMAEGPVTLAKAHAYEIAALRERCKVLEEALDTAIKIAGED